MDIWPLRLACPDCLGLEQLAVPPPSAGGNHSISGHVYTSALSEDASLHQQRHPKKVCLAAAYRKSSCTANSPQYLSTPVLRDITEDYERTFVGMTTEPVELAELLRVHDRLVAELPQTLDANERQFLLSLVSNAPEWPLLDIAHFEQLPAVRWKLRNLAQLAKTSPKKFGEQADALKRLLG
jgi:hypothetical protein